MVPPDAYHSNATGRTTSRTRRSLSQFVDQFHHPGFEGSDPVVRQRIPEQHALPMLKRPRSDASRLQSTYCEVIVCRWSVRDRRCTCVEPYADRGVVESVILARLGRP